jgi:acyl-[acyl-carrier-protein]-phospholipid O-acyltransferase/long-chain-fatty-acid--[acyl-carrier-protein] ligase
MSAGEPSSLQDQPQPAARSAGLSSRGFLCLLATQTLGTLNDNMFRWLAVPAGTRFLGGDEQAGVSALAWGIFWFTLPYLLFPTHAGWLADRFCKRTVIVWCKAAEIVLMWLGLAAILSGSAPCLFAVLFLMGAQAALFAPAKSGTIPDILHITHLSTGNGLMAMVSIIASAAGMIAGLEMFSDPQQHGLGSIAVPALVLTTVALLGWLSSLGIPRFAAASPDFPWPRNPIQENWRQLKLLASYKALLRTALGIAFFFLLATLTQSNIKVFGESVLRLGQGETDFLMLALIVGVGLGSVLAGLWSGGGVELGIVPLGAMGIVAMSLALFAAGGILGPEQDERLHRAYFESLAGLVILGTSAGLFYVPLEAYLQHRSPREMRGTLLAASNFISFAGILSSAAILYVMQNVLALTPRDTFLVIGLATVPIALYAVFLLPQATIRFVTWLMSHTIYRLRVYGRENLPETGGALLVANHVTWVDGAFILISSSRPVRMLAYADYVSGGTVGWFTKLMGVIPIKASEGPKSLLRSLATARQCVQNGELVCIFAEGELTRTGQLQPFQRGLMKIVEGTGAPVIPVYLDGLWGSIFSFFHGKYFWKLPRQWPYPVAILFGRPLRDPDDVHEVRQAVQDLGVDAMEYRKHDEMNLPRMFLRMCRRTRRQPKLADSGGQEMTGGELLLRTLIVKRILARRVLGADEKFVGVLLPPSAGGVLVNAALPLLGRVSVNLNYTASPATTNACIKQSGIRHVITSRLFITKMKLAPDAELVYLEDFKDQVTSLDKLVAFIQAHLVPVTLLERFFGLKGVDPDDLLTIIFTSGSTGEPKGVMLSHHNIGSNVRAIDQMFQLKNSDALLGVLPFFHSFGYTGTLWTVLSLDPRGVYHFNPLDARLVGSLCEKHKVTIMMTTPTFLRGYLKRCEKKQLATLDLVVMGAEKMPLDLAQAFQDKFGVRPFEGYGTTELSPVAAVNIPDHRSQETTQKGTKEGSVGRPIPGTSVRIVDPDSFAELGVDQPGLMLIKGPNVMRGYLKMEQKTAEVIRDGWYITGDIARIDAEGFITITDRASRFSKIGGEMVPHIKVEEIVQKIVRNGADDEGELLAVVTAVPDEKKGERLIVVHKPLPKGVDEVLAELNSSGLPNLWIPSRDSFLEVADIPHLGTGKVDLKGLKELALEKFGAGRS